MSEAAQHTIEAEAPEGRQVADVQDHDARVDEFVEIDPAEQNRRLDDLERDIARVGRAIEKARRSGGPAR